MRKVMDEAKLTAYALGELSERERAEVERYLEGSAEARAEVDSVRETAGLLREALAQEASEQLNPEQRARIESRAAAGPGWWRPAWLGAALAAAAALVAVALLAPRTGPKAEVQTAVLLPSPVEPGAETAPPTAPATVPTTTGPRATPTGTPPRLSKPAATTGSTTTAPGPRENEPARGGQLGGEVRGRAVDEAGGTIPGATVTLTEEASGLARVTRTDAQGRFSIPVPAPGSYKLSVGLAGFHTWEGTGLAAAPRGVADLGDIRLSVGALAETITVQTRVPELMAESGERSFELESPPSDSERSNWSFVRIDDAAVGPAAGIRRQSGPFTTEAYDAVKDNPFVAVAQAPLSTFSIDVDTASYANVRRFLREGELPPPGAVRIEELVNTFTYDYPPPRGEHPFAVHLAAAACPWAPDHELVRIGLKGREIEKTKRPPSNLVFLIDVSGSMDEENKLPLLKRALGLLIGELDERDRVAMVVYAGASGLVLPSTPAGSKGPLLAALDHLQAGGTTHGSEGIRLAYETATANFIEGGVNRVILATDGDFNVGVTSQDELTRLIEEKAKSGVFLTVLGFGMGNYKDSTLEKLADHGNGNYGYIDSLREARRLLVDQMGGTLVTIAKDVKIQVEFNPARVAEYRLIGYENRVMADQDFDDDTKDAGEIGAGHTVTALYEVVPVGAPSVARTTRPLKYQQARRLSKKAGGQEVLTVHLRYKKPAGEASVLLEAVLKGTPERFEEAPADFRFASAVAAFGMILRDSPYRGSASLADVGRWARGALGKDASGQRQELLDLVAVAERLRARAGTPE